MPRTARWVAGGLRGQVDPVPHLVERGPAPVFSLLGAIGAPSRALVEPARPSICRQHPEDGHVGASAAQLIHHVREQPAADFGAHDLGLEVDRIDFTGARAAPWIPGRPGRGDPHKIGAPYRTPHVPVRLRPLDDFPATVRGAVLHGQPRQEGIGTRPRYAHCHPAHASPQSVEPRPLVPVGSPRTASRLRLRRSTALRIESLRAAQDAPDRARRGTAHRPRS